MRPFEEIVMGLTSRAVDVSLLRQLIHPYTEALALNEAWLLGDDAFRKALRTRLEGDMPQPLHNAILTIGRLAERTLVKKSPKSPGQLDILNLLKPRTSLAAATRVYVNHHGPKLTRLLHRQRGLERARFVHSSQPREEGWSDLDRLHLCHLIQDWLEERGAQLLHIAVDCKPDELSIEVLRERLSGAHGLVVDRLYFFPADLELHVWSCWPQVHLFLASAMGTVLFQNPDTFQLGTVFRGTPFLEHGVRSLSTEGCEGIECVKLSRLDIRAITHPFDQVVWKAQNLGMFLFQLPRLMPRPFRIHAYTLRFYLRGERRPVSVKVRPPLFFAQSRNSGSMTIEHFLRLRGFMRRVSPALEARHAEHFSSEASSWSDSN